MSRSLWKGLYISPKDITPKKLQNLPKTGEKTRKRKTVIFEHQIDQHVLIANGQTFYKTKVSKYKVGFKLGAFTLTRNFNKKKILEKKAKELQKKLKGKKTK